jgi:hypothetical protein
MVTIGFGYKCRQGKDQAAQAIIEARGDQYDIRRYAFATELKREITEEAYKFGCMEHLVSFLRANHNLPDWVQLEPNPDMADPECPLGKYRTLLMWYGTDFRRAQNPFYWIEKVRSRMLQEQPQFALITDMRFYNEMCFVKSLGGYTVKVVRTGFHDPSIIEHVSETQLDGKKFDVTIEVADGELEQLRRRAVQTFDMIVNKETLKLPEFTVEAFEREMEGKCA